MDRVTRCAAAVFSIFVFGALTACAQISTPSSRCAGAPPTNAALPQTGAAESIALVSRLTAGQLTSNNRKITVLADTPGAVHVSEASGPGVVWIQGSDFGDGTIDLAVCGRDVYQESFVGVAFHGRDDSAYEAVYVRPFNFRASDPTRHRHAVQYMSLPDFDWPRLRQDFPDQFENPVDASAGPTDWVPLRIVVKGDTIEVYVGNATAPALKARKLGQRHQGLVGLWTGNGSDGNFANVRITR